MYIFLFLALFIQSVLYFYSNKIASKYNLLDIPDQKTKVHKQPTPLTGGIGLLIIPTFYIVYEIYIYGLDRELIAILLIMLTLSILGVLDDKFSYKGKYPDVKKQTSFRWNDPRINAKWPIKSPILSLRDKKTKFL